MNPVDIYSSMSVLVDPELLVFTMAISYAMKIIFNQMNFIVVKGQTTN
jgi:hypothetical protein